MTVLYSNNFDAETTGTLPAGWADKVGTWQVSTSTPVSGAKTLGSASNGDGDVTLYTGISAIADMQIDTKQKAVPGSTKFPLIGHVLRSDVGNNNNYTILFSNMNGAGGGSVLFFKKSGGSYTQLGSDVPISLTYTTGDTIYLRTKIVGSTISVYAGVGSLPGSPIATKTDAAITAAGYPGLYNGKDGQAVSMTIDDWVIDDLATSAATAITMTGPAGGTTGVPSTNFTIGADGVITGTVVVTPSDSAGGGTFTPTTVSISSGTPTATFTYTPATAGAKTISVTNNGSLSNPSGITYTASSSAATAVVVTGPTSGTTGVASTNFTASANGVITGTVVVTPADGGAGGTFTPTTASISSGTPSATFTYTPSSTGVKTLSFTNNGSLTNPANISYTSTATSVTVAVTDVNWKWSPSNWDTNAGVKTAVNGGAYCRLGFTGTSVSIGLDVSSLVAGSVATGWYPSIRYSVDSGPQTDLQLTPSTTALAITGLAAGSHDIKITYLAGWWENIGGTAPDRWTTPVYCLRITGATLATGAFTVTPAWRPKNLLWFGDSISEGIRANNSATQPACQNAYESAPMFLAASLDAELGNVSWGGMNYGAGFNSIPALNTSYSSHFNGRTRLSAGTLVEQPDYIAIWNGANGTPAQGDVQTAIANMRTIAPLARIFVVVPVGGFGRTNITAAVVAYLAANTSETKVHLIDLGSTWEAGLSSFGSATEQGIDGLHPRSNWNARIGAAIAVKMQAAIDGAGAPALNARTVTLTLGDSAGAAANLTGLKVAFYDEAAPNLHTTPRYQSAAETTDATGVLTFPVNSTLAAGGTGHIVVLGAANVHFNGPVVVA